MKAILTPVGQGQDCYIYSERLPGLGWTGLDCAGPDWGRRLSGQGRIQTEVGREHR